MQLDQLKKIKRKTEKKKRKHSIEVTSYTLTQRRIKDRVKHLRWRFPQKQQRTFSR